MESYCFMSTEFQFCKTKSVLEMDSDDGCSNVNVLNTTEMYTCASQEKEKEHTTILKMGQVGKRTTQRWPCQFGLGPSHKYGTDPGKVWPVPFVTVQNATDLYVERGGKFSYVTCHQLSTFLLSTQSNRWKSAWDWQAPWSKQCVNLEYLISEYRDSLVASGLESD